MTTLFVTASGTEIGKTFVSALLIRQLRTQARDVAALKPVVSGLTKQNMSESDPALLAEALGEQATDETVARLSPWRFEAALSPDMAAAREGRAVPFDELMEACLAARAAAPDILVIEGVGGLMAPLDTDHTVRDWLGGLAGRIDVAPLLVVGSYLGTISHTLTALEAMSAVALRPEAIIISESPESPVPPEETAAAITRFAGAVPIAIVPRAPVPPPDLTWLAARPSARK